MILIIIFLSIYYKIISLFYYSESRIEQRYYTSFRACEKIFTSGEYAYQTSCFNASKCVPELCNVPFKPLEPIELFQFNETIKLSPRIKNKKFKIDPRDLKSAITIEEPAGFNVEMKCPMVNITESLSKGRIYWYKCNSTSCEKISKTKKYYIRYKINQLEKTLKIIKLEPFDTGKYICVRQKIIVGNLDLKVLPPLSFYDLRSPLGSMIASTIFVTIIYIVLAILRISLRILENTKVKKKSVQTKKEKNYKLLPKHR